MDAFVLCATGRVMWRNVGARRSTRRR